MSSYDVSASCRARTSRVWGLLLDGSTWPEWSAIDSFEIERPAGAGVLAHRDPQPSEAQGAVRVFRTGRNVSREQIVELEPERRVEYVLLTGSRLLRGYRGRIDLDPVPDEGTRIRWRATWRAPVPGVGWLMQRYLRRFQQEMVDGLARYADRGPSRREPGADAG